jgi:hypothetical protein
MRHVGGVILAGARDPAVARKLGFTPAVGLERAISMAREMAGPASRVTCQVIPPLFCADVGP